MRRDDTPVRITSHGKHFHRQGGCFVRGARTFAISEALREGFYPCSKCFYPQQGHPQVTVGRDGSDNYRRLLKRKSQ